MESKALNAEKNGWESRYDFIAYTQYLKCKAEAKDKKAYDIYFSIVTKQNEIEEIKELKEALIIKCREIMYSKIVLSKDNLTMLIDEVDSECNIILSKEKLLLPIPPMHTFKDHPYMSDADSFSTKLRGMEPFVWAIEKLKIKLSLLI